MAFPSQVYDASANQSITQADWDAEMAQIYAYLAQAWRIGILDIFTGDTVKGKIYYAASDLSLNLASVDTADLAGISIAIGVGTGSTGEIMRLGYMTGLTGLVAGQRYYLGSSGVLSTSPPAFGSGNNILEIGVGISAAAVSIECFRANLKVA